METQRYKAEDLIQFGKAVLVKMGFEDEDALTTSRILVEADLRDIYSHGIAGGSSLDDILAKVKEEGIYPKAKCEFKPQKYPSVVHIDAHGGLGHPVSVKAIDEVKKLARKYGIAKAYVYNSSHFGVAAIYSEIIAEDGDLAGRVTCTAPAWVLPYGGSSRRLGTNPIAWSIPYDGGIVTIDMATSQRAVSHILKLAKLKGEGSVNLAEYGLSDFLVGPDGKVINILGPEHDYDFVRTQCAINPLGGVNYGHKGYGLAFLIEQDNVLGGSNFGFIPPGSKTPEGRVAQTFEAYVIDSLKDKQSMLNLLGHNVDDLKRYGENIKLPGQIEQEYTQERRKNGIPYDAAQISKLKKIGKTVEVPFNVIPITEQRGP